MSWPTMALRFVVPVATGLCVVMPGTLYLVHSTWWALFALLSAVATLVGLRRGRAAWNLAAAATGGLFVFWVLVALPQVTGAAGFFATLATAAAGGALYLSPERPR